MNAWKVIVSTLVIFITGVATGGFLVMAAMRVKQSDEKPTKAMVSPNNPITGNPWVLRNKELLRRMDRELDLTQEQHSQIELIIAESQERLKIMFRPVAPQMNREMMQVRQEIAKELTPEQRKKFEGFAKNRLQPDKRRNGTNSPAGLNSNAFATPAQP